MAPPTVITAAAPPPGDRPADLRRFAAHVEAAVVAFREDVSYAVSMARAAVVIDRKRQVWQARKELREAETRARAECARTAAFDCHAMSPCGVGDCKFATGEHAQLDVYTTGTTTRPQASNTGGYSIEPAVSALVESRRAGL